MTRESDDRDIVLITGSSGLIGTALSRVLANDYRLVGMDRYRPRESGPEIAWHHSDMSDPGSLEATIETIRRTHGERIGSVVHLAAYYDFSGEPSPLYDDLTVRGTDLLLRHLQGFEVGQFVFTSTILAHRPSEGNRPLTEDSPLEAEWDYPESKIRAEEAVREQRGKIPAVILRIAGVYDEDCHSPPISQQISRIYEKRLESYFFPGDSTRGQSFVHLNDVVEVIRRVIERRGSLEEEEVFLIGEADLMSYEDLQETIGKLVHGEEWPAIRIPKPVAKAGAWVKDKLAGDDRAFIQPWMIDLADAHYPVSIQRARERLGWTPRYRLREVLPEMIRRLRDDPQGWYRENGITPPESVEASQSAATESDSGST